MKKFSIFTLLAVMLLSLAMVFTACSSSDDDGGGPGSGTGTGSGDDTIVNPIADGAKFLNITSRTANYFTLDIKAGKEGNDGFTAGKAHTIKVYGKAPANTAGIKYGNANSPYATYSGSETTAGADGSFTLNREFSVTELTDTAQNIRIAVPESARSFYIYEVTIEDEDGTSVYKMSEDDEIQALPAGETQFFKDPADGGGSTWFWKAGSPKIIVLVPGEEIKDEKIDLAVPGLKPIKGEAPKATVDTDQYTGTVTWDPDDAAFVVGTVYTATITLTAKTGYTFEGVAADSLAVTGADTVTHEAGTGTSLVITAEFPAPLDVITWDTADGMTTGIGAQGSATFADGIIDLTTTGSSALFTVAATGATSTSTITIKYICKVTTGSAQVILKNGGWSTDLLVANGTDGLNWYPTLTADAVSTLVVKGSYYTNPATGIWFQRNGDNNAFKIKILEVTVE